MYKKNLPLNDSSLTMTANPFAYRNQLARAFCRAGFKTSYSDRNLFVEGNLLVINYLDEYIKIIFNLDWSCTFSTPFGDPAYIVRKFLALRQLANRLQAAKVEGFRRRNL